MQGYAKSKDVSYFEIPIDSAPVGSMVQWVTANPPINWVFTDGAAISRADNPELFSIIGTTFGTGDGLTTFNVPNIKVSGFYNIIKVRTTSQGVFITGDDITLANDIKKEAIKYALIFG